MGVFDMVAAPILDIVNKLIPDPAAKAQMQLEVAQLAQQTEFKQLDTQLALVQTQTNTNQTEASNQQLFVAGWRP
ncbi:MAG TPA: 3TM-type holin, partial [Bacteroidia bacterium]|nr:3TM-type holin [Bacteroidia bacterium]